MEYMTNKEIKQEIDSRQNMIKEILNPNIFTLDKAIESLQKEISELQNQCSHVYKDGNCIYCYKDEDN